MFIKKQPLTLLEVLIAFFLIVIAVIPLIAPFRTMLIESDRKLKELEYDRQVPILYVDLLARYLRGEIVEGQLEQEVKHPLQNGYYQFLQTPLGWYVVYVFQIDGKNLIYEFALPRLK